MANVLIDHKCVNDVYHPALAHTRNHHIWKRDFSGSSGLFAFSLKKKYSNNEIERFYNKLKIFKLGYSWGGFESLITFPPVDNRTFKSKIPGNIIRIYCGLEDSKDQINDILNALKIFK
jgi:cystathionine beta-lyase